MPRKTCLIPDCPSIESNSCKFYCMPCNDTMRALWMPYLLPLVPSLRSCIKKQLVRRRVCRLHFEDKYIREDGKRVIDGAPTLFTKEEIKSGIPTKPLPSMEPQKLFREHNYSAKPAHTDHNYSQKFDKLDQETTDINDFPDDDVGDNADWLGNAVEPGDLPDFTLDPTITNNNRKDGLQKTRTPLKVIQPMQNPQRTEKINEIQYFMDEFIKEIESDIEYQAPEDTELPTIKRKFADELHTYNFTSEVIVTNKRVKQYDKMEHLMYPEKAYAAITFCLLRQQDLFEESIRDFLMWAANSELTYEIIEKRVADIFENGEFIEISLKILKIICKYRMKNIQIRKKNIADQASDPEMKESLSKIPHSTVHLFDENELISTLDSAPNIYGIFATTNTNSNSNVTEIKLKSKSKHDRATQANILPKKSDKTVQVKPKKARKAAKCVQVNSNELESIATAKKVKKKDTGSQTTEKDKLLSASVVLHDNPPLRERSEIIQDSPLSHCQKIQYVVNIKRKPPRHDGVTNPIKDSHSLESNPQAGPKFQHVPRDPSRLDTNNETCQDQNSFNKSKKKRKSIKRPPEPSMPTLWDTCQNLLSLGGESNITETETEQVYSTLERKSVTPRTLERKSVTPKRGRPNFGKKRRPKIPETLKEHNSPMKSTGTSPMRGTSDSFQVPGQSTSTLHVCDSPYLLGGCKHTYNPKSESVPLSRMHKTLNILKNPNQGFSGGKRPRYDISEPTRLNEEVPRNSDFHESSPVVVQAQNQTNPSSPMHLLAYDNLLSRWS